MAPFTLSASTGTDLWKKPPTTDDSNAATHQHSKGALEKLRSATAKFTSRYTTQYDQAGLVLRLTNPSSSAVKWVKAGIEFFNGQPRLSIVACERYADWSVAPLPADASDDIRDGKRAVTIQVEKVNVGLWFYVVGEDGSKEPLRELTWFYANEGEGWEVEVGALVARPDVEVTGDLEAKFDVLEVEWEQ